MKQIFQFITAAFCLLTISNPLLADWTETSGPGSTTYALTAKGTNLFAGTSNAGAFLTSNNGTIWNPINNGLTSTDVRAFAVNGSNLFAAIAGGVFISHDDGTSWTAVNNGLTNLDVRALAVMGNKIYAATYGGGIFTSINNGTNWVSSSNGFADSYVRALAVMGTNMIAGANGGVYISIDNGANWTQFISGMTNREIFALAVSGTNIFAGTEGAGIYFSSDNGANWTTVNTGLTSLKVKSFAVSGTNIFAGTLDYTGGVFLSTNNGMNWTEVITGLTNNRITSLFISGDNIYAGTHGGNVWKRSISEISSIDDNTTLPACSSLTQNYPNPFNPTTTISFNLKSTGLVDLSVYNVKGELVVGLLKEYKNAGNHQITFDGAGLNSGTYFYKLEADGNTMVKRMILVK